MNKSILLFGLTLILSSCLTTATAVKHITVENEAIPPDFGKDDSYLICVLSGKNSYDKYVKKHVTNHFHGKYKLVLKNELESDKYKDVSVYRFVLDRTIERNLGSGKNSDNYTYTNDFQIFDRKMDKTYDCPIRAASFSKLLEAYMINLEKVRLKNKS